MRSTQGAGERDWPERKRPLDREHDETPAPAGTGAEEPPLAASGADTHAIPRHPVWPPAYAVMAAGAMVALDRWAPGVILLTAPWIWIGVVPLAAGTALALLAEWRFWRVRTPVLPNRTPRSLVTSGVFAISRNPMYLAMTLALAGLWLLLGSASPGVMVPAFVVIIDRLFVRREERRLEAVFGQAFRDYRRRVRRWI